MASQSVLDGHYDMTWLLGAAAYTQQPAVPCCSCGLLLYVLLESS